MNRRRSAAGALMFCISLPTLLNIGVHVKTPSPLGPSLEDPSPNVSKNEKMISMRTSVPHALAARGQHPAPRRLAWLPGLTPGFLCSPFLKYSLFLYS